MLHLSQVGLFHVSTDLDKHLVATKYEIPSANPGHSDEFPHQEQHQEDPFCFRWTN